MKTVKFTAEHSRTCAHILSISEDEFRKRALDHLKALAADSSEWKSSWRSVATFLEGAKAGQEPTRSRAVQVLCEIGLDCDDEWLLSDGTRPPTITKTIPQVSAPQIVVNKEAQKLIGELYSGLYALYRPHGTNEARLVRELFWIDNLYRLNHRSALLNRNGSMYLGSTYKSAQVLYSYLFRPHPDFGFSSRLLSIAVPASGTRRSLGGVIYRIRRITSMGAASDLILVKIKDKNASSIMQKMVNEAEQHAALDAEPFDLKAFKDSIRPRRFENENCMSDQEKRISSALRNADDTPKQISATSPQQVDELDLNELP